MIIKCGTIQCGMIQCGADTPVREKLRSSSAPRSKETAR
jgi:hypothetical protein